MATMLFPPHHYRSWSASTLSALGFVCLTVTATQSVAADATAADSCNSMLSRLQDAGKALGYTVTATASGFRGVTGQSHLGATCSSGQVTIELQEGSSSVEVAYGGASAGSYALEIIGAYPGVGRVIHAAGLEGDAMGSLAGTLMFTADTDDASAFVELDLAGKVVSEGGDVAVVNERLGQVLAASSAWTEAHVLTLALAGMWEPHGGLPEMSIASTVAVPSPRGWGIKKSIIAQAMTCGAATITCTVAASGFVPAAGSCVHSASTCMLAIGCAVVSCLD